MPITINEWKGDAQGVAQEELIEVANVQAGDAFTLTINDKDVVITAEATDQDVYAAMIAAIGPGATIAEFKELTAEAVYDDDGTTLIGVKVIGPSSGKPFTMTVASSGTLSDTGGVSVATLIPGSAARNEIQRVSHGGTGGTFTLSYNGQTTAALAYNISAASLKTALEGLASIGAGNVNVTLVSTGVWLVEFTGTLSVTNVGPITGNGASLTGAATITIVESVQGVGTQNTIYNLLWYSDAALTKPITSGDFAFLFSGLYGNATFTLNAADSQAQLQAKLDMALGSFFRCVVRPSTTYAALGSRAWDIEFIGDYAGIDMSGSDPYSQTRWSGGFSAQGLHEQPVWDSSIVGYTKPQAFQLLEQQEGTATGRNEKQIIRFAGSPSGGTWSLAFRGATTSSLAYNISNADLKTALEATSTITGVAVSTPTEGGGWLVEFTDPGSEDLPMLEATNNLTGGNITVATYQNSAVAVNEQQQITLAAGVTGGTFTLTYSGQETGDLAFDISADNLQTALESLSNIAPGDVTVSGSGPWTVLFTGTLAGTDVAAMTADGANLTGVADTITITSQITPTGPAFFNEAKNWSLGHVPADGEYVVFANSDHDCLYGLSNATTTPAKLIFDSTYTGKVGLPDDNGSYREYRPTRLRIGNAADGVTMIVEVGRGDKDGSGRIRLDTGDCPVILEGMRTAEPADGAPVAFDWIGTAATNVLHLYRGSYGIGAYPGDEATFGTLLIGFVDQQDTDVKVEIGTQVTLGTVTKHGGSLRTQSSIVAAFEQTAGVSSIEGDETVAISGNVAIRGGTFYHQAGGTIGGNVLISGAGKFDFTRDFRAKTVSNAIDVYGDTADVNDPFKTIASLVIDYNETTRQPNLGSNYRITRAATA